MEKEKMSESEIKEYNRRIEEVFKKHGMKPKTVYGKKKGYIAIIPGQKSQKEEVPEQEKPHVTADMLNRMIDDECIRRGLPLIRNGNKTGTKITVNFSLPEETGPESNNGKDEETIKDQKQEKWSAESSAKAVDEMLIRNGFQPATPVEKTGSGIIIRMKTPNKKST